MLYYITITPDTVLLKILHYITIIPEKQINEAEEKRKWNRSCTHPVQTMNMQNGLPTDTI